MYSSVCMLASPQGLFVWSTKCQKKKFNFSLQGKSG